MTEFFFSVDTPLDCRLLVGVKRDDNCKVNQE